jgi:hypothetical protein
MKRKTVSAAYLQSKACLLCSLSLTAIRTFLVGILRVSSPFSGSYEKCLVNFWVTNDDSSSSEISIQSSGFKIVSFLYTSSFSWRFETSDTMNYGSSACTNTSQHACRSLSCQLPIPLFLNSLKQISNKERKIFWF